MFKSRHLDVAIKLEKMHDKQFFHQLYAIQFRLRLKLSHTNKVCSFKKLLRTDNIKSLCHIIPNTIILALYHLPRGREKANEPFTCCGCNWEKI